VASVKRQRSNLQLIGQSGKKGSGGRIGGWHHSTNADPSFQQTVYRDSGASLLDRFFRVQNEVDVPFSV